jgi:hypothetical protein
MPCAAPVTIAARLFAIVSIARGHVLDLIPRDANGQRSEFRRERENSDAVR